MKGKQMAKGFASKLAGKFGSKGKGLFGKKPAGAATGTADTGLADQSTSNHDVDGKDGGVRFGGFAKDTTGEWSNVGRQTMD